jgi:hypothetical protein
MYFLDVVSLSAGVTATDAVTEAKELVTNGRILLRLSKVNVSLFLHSLLQNLEDNDLFTTFAGRSMVYCMVQRMFLRG